MKNGHLSQYFDAVAAKRLSAVEVDKDTSHQHEFNGTKELKAVIRTTERTIFNCKFLKLAEEENETISWNDTVTWYNSRENVVTRSPEFRLYFPDNDVMSTAKEGDTLFIAKRTDNSLLIIIASEGSTVENQLYWLFGLDKKEEGKYDASDIKSESDKEIDFVTRLILDELGIETEEPESDLLDILLADFKGSFPSTFVFSDHARKTLKDPFDVREDPDGALLMFMNWEEKLFRRMEHQIVADRLKQGFELDGIQDVDTFISFSLSVQNRRKARAGRAFEYHIAHIFQANELRFVTGVETENKSRPDFLFPGIEEYRSPAFPVELLTLLGAKTSCKERWRQVLAESARIKIKHLLTLEPGISEYQTNEMKADQLQLVLPKEIHSTYSGAQQNWLINLKEFIGLVLKKQNIRI